MIELLMLILTALVAVGGYLYNCYRADRWLTWKEWGEFNGD